MLTTPNTCFGCKIPTSSTSFSCCLQTFNAFRSQHKMPGWHVKSLQHHFNAAALSHCLSASQGSGPITVLPQIRQLGASAGTSRPYVQTHVNASATPRSSRSYGAGLRGLCFTRVKVAVVNRLEQIMVSLDVEDVD